MCSVLKIFLGLAEIGSPYLVGVSLNFQVPALIVFLKSGMWEIEYDKYIYEE